MNEILSKLILAFISIGNEACDEKIKLITEIITILKPYECRSRFVLLQYHQQNFRVFKDGLQLSRIMDKLNLNFIYAHLFKRNI